MTHADVSDINQILAYAFAFNFAVSFPLAYLQQQRAYNLTMGMAFLNLFTMIMLTVATW